MLSFETVSMISQHASTQPCCLIAEDQAVIAMWLEDSLEEAGLAVAGPFNSCQAALDWIETHTPAVAILDVQLRDGPCTELARTLADRGVPVLIYSGVDRHSVPAELDGLPWIEKPASYSDLLAAVRQAVPALPALMPVAAH
jgi:DNA-binding response OmpR family regulator